MLYFVRKKNKFPKKANPSQITRLLNVTAVKIACSSTPSLWIRGDDDSSHQRISPFFMCFLRILKININIKHTD